ncbi:MAG: cation diffusion facilitator family transporter [Muribaculaceae bacterium]|nr:cation diffusion facilitator family transporter [Muribaculaceae bacterium]
MTKPRKKAHGAPSKAEISDKEAVRRGKRATWVGFWVNAALGVLKVWGGIVGRSGALVADGLHSFSDFITDAIVLAVVGISRRKPDEEYQYGRGKYETGATLLVSVILVIVAVGLFADGVESVISWAHGTELPQPAPLALIIIILSIGAKEWLFHYTRRVGRSIGSAAVVANAWHHRSDALSSVATLVGVAGAVLLSPRWRVLDPIAVMVVAVFIAIVGVKMALPAVKELLEVSLPQGKIEEIKAITASTPGVITFHRLRSRRNGSRFIIDMHIKVAPDISVCRGHEIASKLERELRRGFGQSTIMNIHVEPYKGEEIRPDGSCE